MKTLFIITLSLTLFSCGFKPINEKGVSLIHLQKIDITGEKRIGYVLKNNISLISDKNSANKYRAVIQVEKQKNSKIKNKAGKIIRYNLLLKVNLQLTDIINNTEMKKQFLRDLDYNVSDIHSDTINNENNAIKNIIQQISEDMNNFLSLSLRNK